jgi:hypothetical protein
VTHLPISYAVISLIIVAALIALWLKGERDCFFEPILILACGYAHLSVMMLAAAAASFRYSLWFVFCVVVAGFVTATRYRNLFKRGRLGSAQEA